MIRCVKDGTIIYVVVSEFMEVEETAEFLIHNGNVIRTDLTQIHKCKYINDMVDFYRVYYFDDNYVDVKKVI